MAPGLFTAELGSGSGFPPPSPAAPHRGCFGRDQDIPGIPGKGLPKNPLLAG